MREDQRIWAVKQLLFDYVKSPSLRHIRDPHSLGKLALEIVRRIDRGNSIWKKWDGQREGLLNSAAGCWIPVEDLRDFLTGTSCGDQYELRGRRPASYGLACSFQSGELAYATALETKVNPKQSIRLGF